MRFIISFNIILYYTFVQGQNLIIDGSFEESRHMIEERGVFSIYHQKDENKVTSISHVDYFHLDCSSEKYFLQKHKDCELYNNPFGPIFPKHGLGLAGIAPFYEYLIFKLKSPLEKNKTYCLQYFISKPNKIKNFSDNYITNSKYSMIEALFFNNYPNPNLNATEFFCAKCKSRHSQKENLMLHQSKAIMKNNIVDDTVWCKNGGYYNAKGGEQFILLGNFRSVDSEEMKKFKRSEKIEIGGKIRSQMVWTRGFYYFIDDVTLIEVNSSNNCDCIYDKKAKIEYANELKKGKIIAENRISLENVKLSQLHNGEVYILERVEFDSDKANLNTKSMSELDRLAKQIIQLVNKKIHIIGHADSESNSHYNMDISTKRAMNTTNYLIQKGVNSNNIIYEGRGETEPYFSNNDSIGRSYNRRVEIIIESQ